MKTGPLAPHILYVCLYKMVQESKTGVGNVDPGGPLSCRV